MAIGLLFHSLLLLGETVISVWHRWRLPSKIAAGASVFVICGMAHLGMVVSGYIRDNVVQRSAAAAALYMDSFVEPHVQELAITGSLSKANRNELGRLLSPASMHRPVVAFKIWSGNVVVFSNERAATGKAFPSTQARERAWQGHVGVELDNLDGEDDEQVRSLNVPLLEVYAPVRERGTGRIIAIAETYEIASDLKTQVLVDQLASWLAISAVSLTMIAVLFSLANSGVMERNSLVRRIAELTHLRAESERRRQRVSHANLHVNEMNERSMRRVETALREGPAQFVALALLKFDSLDRLCKANGENTPNADEHILEDLEIIRKALNETLRHIQVVSTTLLPNDIEQLSVAETFANAVRRHERRTGLPVGYVAQQLPSQLPFPVKACLYRFVLEGLGSMWGDGCTSGQVMRASFDGEKLALEIVGPYRTIDGAPRPLDTGASVVSALRDRVEAVGGSFSFRSSPGEGISLVAEFSFSEVAGG